MDESHDVGVLLDGPRFAQVRKLGRFEPPRSSVARLNCERAMIGTFNSLAMAFNVREMKATSCSRLPFESCVPPVINCK